MDLNEFKRRLHELPDAALADLSTRCVALYSLIDGWGALKGRLLKLRIALCDECELRQPDIRDGSRYFRLGLWTAAHRAGVRLAGLARHEAPPARFLRLAEQFAAAPLALRGPALWKDGPAPCERYAPASLETATEALPAAVRRDDPTPFAPAHAAVDMSDDETVILDAGD